MIGSYHGRGILWFILLLFIPFAIAVFMLPNDLLLQGARILHVCASLAVVISYSAAAWNAFRQPAFRSIDMLKMAIFSSFVGNFGFGLVSLLWRLGGQPHWLANSALVAFFVSMQTIAAILYLAAPGALDGHVPPRGKVVIGVVLGLGAVVVLLFAAVNIDVLPLLKLIRPGLDENWPSPCPGC
jgi:hypothetical protein